MATQAEIQALINEIQTNANYPATKMNPLLSAMLDFASAGQTQVFDGLVANNTTMAGTTLVLQYGVNIIETSTQTNFACKLPAPVTGKRVIVVNKSTFSVSLFPSMTGGQINNYDIDAPAIIPPDGRAYDFICVENPLPGAWVWSPPAIGQYDSGEITATTTSSAFGRYIAAASIVGGPTYAAERDGLFASSGVAVNGANQPLVWQPAPPAAIPNSTYIPNFKPAAYWNSIVKIKVYTNIVPVSGDEPGFALVSGSAFNLYNPPNPYQTFDLDANNPYVNIFTLSNAISGSASPGLATNIGDAGTAWGELNITPALLLSGINQLSFVGDVPNQTTSTGEVATFTRALTAYLCPRVVGAVKFRFIIEFN
jgi:hypothetical protein